MTTKRIVSAAAGGAIVVLIVAGFIAAHSEQTHANDEPPPEPNRMHTIQGPAGDEAAIILPTVVQHRVGLETRVVKPASQPNTIRLSGVLIASPARITTIQSLVAGRLTDATGHWPSLGEEVAAGAVLGQVSDARPLVAPRAGTVTRVDAQPGDLVSAGQQLLQLTDFRHLLARVVWHAGAPRSAPRTISLSPLGDASIAAVAQLIGPDARADSLTGEPVYLYRVDAAWDGARPGAPIVATLAIAGTVDRAALVPADAVVQWQGLAWAYVRRGGDAAQASFVRRRVDTSHPVSGGWLVSSTDPLAVHAGDTVVVRGAQELLSEEFRSRITVGDEDQP
ncbi:MAG TPA: HlyD family efflux transporter periplasmic adaptor subunit [Gemmatimonadaceae bacterium]